MVAGTGDFRGRRDKHVEVEEETHRIGTDELDSTTGIGLVFEGRQGLINISGREIEVTVETSLENGEAGGRRGSDVVAGEEKETI